LWADSAGLVGGNERRRIVRTAADPLQIGNLLAHLVQFGTPEHQAEILKMGTTNAARVIGVAEDYGLAVGKQADLVILDTLSVADALLDLPPRSWVIKRGRVAVVTTVECRICRGCGRLHARSAPVAAQGLNRNGRAVRPT